MGDWKRKMYLKPICRLALNIKLTWSCQKEKAGESVPFVGRKRKPCVWSILVFILGKETKFTIPPKKSTFHWMPWMGLAWGANTPMVAVCAASLQLIIWHNILEGLQRRRHGQCRQRSVHNAGVLCTTDPKVVGKSTAGTVQGWIINILCLWHRDVTHLFYY